MPLPPGNRTLGTRAAARPPVRPCCAAPVPAWPGGPGP